MNKESLLAIAMAKERRTILLGAQTPQTNIPNPLRPSHLLWMCEQICEHAEDGSAIKLHRWLGFIQASLIANRILDLNGVKAMFDQLKVHYEGVDDDLTDHLDPADTFEFEIGGEA